MKTAMATIATQKDLVVTLKKETILTVKSLSRFHPLDTGLRREIFKENALEKTTQKLFYHLSYYLLSIIDNQVSSKLPWPLYDTASEKAFRNGLCNFINIYNSKGLSPIMSSYLVNPSCYKVTLLIYQMAQLAIQKTLITKMKRETQTKLYNDITESFKSQNMKSFKLFVEKETRNISIKFSTYMSKRKNVEHTAEIMRNRITEMEQKISLLNPQKYLNNLVDGFIEKHSVDANVKSDVLAVKNVYIPSQIFESWLLEVDDKITDLESEWSKRMDPFTDLCMNTQHSSEVIIDRYSGKVDKSSYTLEYNPKMDIICTKELQNQVNSEQKYVLMNIVKNNQLSLPNLIRGYLVAISFILKNSEDSIDIYKLNEYLDGACGKYSEMATSMTELMDKMMTIEMKLKSEQNCSENRLESVKSFTEIYKLPDLSDLIMGKDLQSQAMCDTYTPLNITKHQFNLRRNTDAVFTKPQASLQFITPFCQGPSDDFLKTLISYRGTADRANRTNLNMSIASQTHFRANETIATTSSGFTKEQIIRLLSTKKSSSSKKFHHKTERPANVNIKKGGLFNETQHTFMESSNLYRSYSSPNLTEYKEKKCARVRKMSVMQENSPLLEVSGISMLTKDNSYAPSEGIAAITKNLFDAQSLPVIDLASAIDDNISNGNEMISPMHFEQSIMQFSANVSDKDELKTDTPKNNVKITKSSNSLEKIINRFKKVRASVIPPNDSRTFVPEKENMNMVNTDISKQILLPDLLTLNSTCSGISKKTTEDYDAVCFTDIRPRRPRESLGTVLGVDHTFLDQFELID